MSSVTVHLRDLARACRPGTGVGPVLCFLQDAGITTSLVENRTVSFSVQCQFTVEFDAAMFVSAAGIVGSALPDSGLRLVADTATHPDAPPGIADGSCSETSTPADSVGTVVSEMARRWPELVSDSEKDQMLDDHRSPSPTPSVAPSQPYTLVEPPRPRVHRPASAPMERYYDAVDAALQRRRLAHCSGESGVDGMCPVLRKGGLCWSRHTNPTPQAAAIGELVRSGRWKSRRCEHGHKCLFARAPGLCAFRHDGESRDAVDAVIAAVAAMQTA